MENVLSFTLRIDEKLMEEFKKYCEKEKRSANSQILILIEEYIKEQEKKAQKWVFLCEMY